MALNAIIHRKRPSWWQRYHQAPNFILAKTLYSLRQHLITNQPNHNTAPLNVTIVCTSDTHNSQPPLPAGDILIHAGDLTQTGTIPELQAELDWLNTQPHPHKIVIAGNHDIALDSAKAAEFDISPGGPESLHWGSIIYLNQSWTTLQLPNLPRLLKLYGHLSTKKHGNSAFQHPRGVDVFSNTIPSDTDILITHSPPRYHLDLIGLGDEFLLRELWRVKPKLHVFGHIHEGYGKEGLVYDRFERLYEGVCAGREGIGALVRMLGILIWGQDGEVKRTVLVNAPAVGGILDRGWREVQVVQL